MKFVYYNENTFIEGSLSIFNEERYSLTGLKINPFITSDERRTAEITMFPGSFLKKLAIMSESWKINNY